MPWSYDHEPPGDVRIVARDRSGAASRESGPCWLDGPHVSRVADVYLVRAAGPALGDVSTEELVGAPGDLPEVFYFGTPVVLVSSINPDGTANLAPMSSAWWLGRSCMLGLDGTSQTTANLARDGDCVLNLASADLVDAVERLALLTGSAVLPEHKAAKGFRYEPDKFAAAGLTPVPADLVGAPRAAECPDGHVSPIQVGELIAQRRRAAVPDGRCPAPHADGSHTPP